MLIRISYSILGAGELVQKAWCFRLGNNEGAGLEVSFIEEEVLSALFVLNGDKALGLDGFFCC